MLGILLMCVLAFAMTFVLKVFVEMIFKIKIDLLQYVTMGASLSFVFIMLSVSAFAQDQVPAEALPPEWIGGILIWLKSIPTVGPILVEVLKWVSVLATVFTVIATTASTLLKIPEIAARISGAEKLADGIKAFHDKVMPWLKYLSVYNVQAAKKK
jgi:hypothetical protein